tara:strand:- start:16169 stop:18322 length:2154 start_codon:yes stop_codon:yes gene_type:complete
MDKSIDDSIKNIGILAKENEKAMNTANKSIVDAVKKTIALKKEEVGGATQLANLSKSSVKNIATKLNEAMSFSVNIDPVEESAAKAVDNITESVKKTAGEFEVLKRTDFSTGVVSDTFKDAGNAIKELTGGILDLNSKTGDAIDKVKAAFTIVMTPFKLANDAIVKTSAFFGKEINPGQKLTDLFMGYTAMIDGEKVKVDGLKDKIIGKFKDFAIGARDALFKNDPRRNPETGRFQKEYMGFFPKLTQSVGNIFTSVKDGITGVATNIASGVGNAASTIGNAFSSAFSAVGGVIQSGLASIGITSESLADAWSTIKDTASNFVGAIKDTVVAVGSEIGGVLSNAFSFVKDGISNAASSLMTGVGNVLSGAKDYIMKSSIVTSIQSFAGTLMTTAAGALAAAGTYITGAMTTLATGFTAVGTGLLGGASALLAAAGRYLVGLYSVVTAKLVNAFPLLGAGVSLLAAGLSFIAGLLSVVAAKLVVAAPFIAIGLAIVAAVALWIMAIMYVVKNFEDIKAYVMEKIEAFRTGFQNVISNITEGFMNVWYSISDWVREKILKWKGRLFGLSDEEEAELKEIQERKEKRKADKEKKVDEPAPPPQEERAKLTPAEETRIAANALGLSPDEYKARQAIGALSKEQQLTAATAIEQAGGEQLATAQRETTEQKDSTDDMKTAGTGDVNTGALNQQINQITQQSIKDPAPHNPDPTGYRLSVVPS